MRSLFTYSEKEVEILATETVNRVLQKERESETRMANARLDAKQQSDRLIRDSGAEAAQMITDAKQRAADIISGANAKAEAEYSAAAEKADRKCRELKEKNSGLKEKAVDITAKILF